MPLNANYPHLHRHLGDVGGALLVSVLRDVLTGTAHAVPQDDSKATYAPMITHATAAIDFNEWDANTLERLSRAISYQRPLTSNLPSGNSLHLHSPTVLPALPSSLNSREQNDYLMKIIAKLETPGDSIYERVTQTLAIRCARGTYLSVPSLKSQNRSLTSAKEWWNGVRREWLSAAGVLRLGADMRAAT